MPIAQEMTDSRPLLKDPQSLAARFAEDGFLLLRGVVDPARVEQVRREVCGALWRAGGWLAPGSAAEDAVPGPLIIREGDENWWGGYTEIQKLEAFHALAHDEGLLGVAARLIDDEVLVHPRKIARVTYPGSAYPTPAHQDFPLLQGAADTFTMWLPLVPCRREMGPLHLLRGSHRDGVRPVVLRPGVGGIGVDVDDDDPNFFTTDYFPGDLVVFHSFTVHSAPANNGDALRLSVDFRYQSAREPIGAMSLDPHGYPNCPGWDELTAGWSTTRWIEAPSGLSVEDFRDPFGDIGAPTSRHVDAGQV